MKRLHLVLFAFLFNPIIGFGQACCSGGVPISGSLGASTSTHRALQLNLTYDLNNLSSLQDGATVLYDDVRNRRTHSLIFEADYGILKWLSATALFSGVRQERTIRNETLDRTEKTTSLGLGDAVLLAKFKILGNKERSLHSLIIGAGPKIPIGSTDKENDIGLPLPADMQPGSGSWDGIFWLLFQKNQLFDPNLTFTFNTTYRVNGTTDRFAQSAAYQFGNEFRSSAGFSYRFLFLKTIWDAQLTGKFRQQVADKVNTRELPSSGGLWVYAIPAINVYITKKLTFRLSSEIPVYDKVDGTQLTTSYRISAGFGFKFEKRSPNWTIQ